MRLDKERISFHIQRLVASAKQWLDRLRSLIKRYSLRVREGIAPLLNRVGVRRRRSLVGRILFLQSLWSVLITLIAVTGIWWASSYLIEENLYKRGVEWITELDDLGTPIYASRNKKQAERIEQRIKNFPEIAYVRYYDADGKTILAEYRHTNYRKLNLPRLLPREQSLLNDTTSNTRPHLIDNKRVESIYRVSSPVQVKSIPNDGLMTFDLNRSTRERIKVIGYIDFGLDRSRYTRQLYDIIIVGSIASVFIILFAVFIGRYLMRQALAPLSRLKLPLARLARGETEVHVESVGDEEIIAISRALNTTIKAVKERDEQLKKMADHDPLTGLVNRTYLMREITGTLEEAKYCDASSALLFIDLDQFKYVNDTVGHGAGDRLLIKVAEALSRRVREHDVIARFGGDEFVMLARDVDQSGAVGIALGILRVLQEMRFVEGGHSFNIYCSIGITMIDSDRSSVEELLSQSDMACFQAKSHGRNRYHMFEVSDYDKKTLVADIGWSQRIRDAIDKDHFVLNYQPIVGIRQNGVEFYEVLLRIPDQNGKLVGPAVFFPAAERFGMMVDIDYWVIRKALQVLAEYHADGRQIQFSINLSGQVFDDQALASEIVEGLEKNNVPGSAVIFEITEQTAVRYMGRASSLIQSLRNYGCRFALDDFGEGFSSYSYIKNLPIDFIKISGSFIADINIDKVDQTMVQSMVQVAQALGKQTIAESVEYKPTFKILKKMGVDYFQGLYFGEPTPTLPDWDKPRKIINS